jgi:transposase
VHIKVRFKKFGSHLTKTLNIKEFMMTTNNFIRQFLNIVGLTICNFYLDQKNKVLELYVKPYKNGCRCPHCNRRGKIVRTMDVRTWRDVVVCGFKVIFFYAPKIIDCETHGHVQENIPWAESYAKVTHRLEFQILIYCQMMTQKAAAEILHLATSTLSDLLHRVIERVRDGHKIKDIKSIGIDEISYAKGRKFATVIYDLDKSKVVWVGKGKGRETVDKFFDNELTDAQKKKIKWASCDMYQTYIDALEYHCPNVKVVLDRFHVAKALNEALDKVRKEEWEKIDVKKRKSFKGIRWLLFKHPSKRSEEETEIINSLRNSNRRIHRAWILKDEFNQIWDFKTVEEARFFLKRWTTTALKSRLEPIRKFVRTVRKHSERIVSFVLSGLSNAKAEGINRIIKIIKNRASGFRSLDAFIDMIYLTIGDVDIAAKIPA